MMMMINQFKSVINSRRIFYTNIPQTMSDASNCCIDQQRLNRGKYTNRCEDSEDHGLSVFCHPV
jgi:hypothetical protein